ncbi:MAG: 4Fe-4S dicluster domain-containing protein [Planctomycetes bacterium]|nr:4Fe-4S dicluster domain-containing protein [Planctomycetota bacterium]
MPESSKSGAIVVELRKCLACRSCEIACAKAHAGVENILDAIMEEIPLMPRVKVIAAGGTAVPVQCQHCEDAPCVAVCPSGALYKDEETGKTLTAPEKCIGCHACIVACPFGAVAWSTEEKRIIKCDLCEGIIEEGEDPRCVTACPTHCRKVVDLDQLVKERQLKAAGQAVRAAEEQEKATVEN